MISQGMLLPKDTAWRKASRSVGQGACVEVASFPDTTVTRDSKNPSGPVLAFDDGRWAVFLKSVKNGRFG